MARTSFCGVGMEEGNGYDKSWGKAMQTLGRVDRRTETIETEVSSLKVLLQTIAANTGTVANFFQAMQEGNLELSKLAAGKRQVPLYAFMLLLILCGAYVIIQEVKN